MLELALTDLTSVIGIPDISRSTNVQLLEKIFYCWKTILECLVKVLLSFFLLSSFLKSVTLDLSAEDIEVSTLEKCNFWRAGVLTSLLLQGNFI